MDTNEQHDSSQKPDSPQTFWQKWKWPIILPLSVVAFCGLAYIAIYAIFIIAWFWNGPTKAEYSPDGPWVECQAQIPGEEPVTLGLPMNTGGRTMINVYSCCIISPEGEETPMLLLIDQQWEMLVDLKKAEMANDPMSGMSAEEELGKISHKKYIGRLDARETSLKFIPACESAEEPIATP